MKGKNIMSIILSLLISFGACTVAFADTILFPVIAINQPNVTTIVSVFNLPGYTSTHLKYIYRSKESLVGGSPNHTGTCSTTTFTRPTFDSDLVSFDASGIFNSGNALFDDPNTYGGGFGLGLTGPRRAYLLVTNSDAGGNRVNVGDDQALGGEAIIMDIAYGAAWGVKGVNDSTREDYNFTKSGVGVAMHSGGADCKWFSFFPPNEWTTRFFVTPIGNNMDTANLQADFTLWSLYDTGLYTRGGTLQTFDVSTDVTCTAGVDLDDMIDSTVLSAIENTGGWAWLCGGTSSTFSPNPFITYKLEYVVEDSTYGGTNNNGFLLSIDNSAW